jgi:hypothetical protein
MFGLMQRHTRSLIWISEPWPFDFDQTAQITRAYAALRVNGCTWFFFLC